MRETKTPDVFEKHLETHLQTWRDVTPSAHLKQRIAAAAAPRRRFYGRPLLAACCCAGAVWAFLAWPGSPVQPAPAFAEVERAMRSVENMSFTLTMETRHSGGFVEQQTAHKWIQRYPPASIEEAVVRYKGKEYISRGLSNDKQKITFRQPSGQSGKWEISPQQPDFALSTEKTFLLYVQPGKDDPLVTETLRKKYATVLPPWRTSGGVRNKQPVWIFTRTIRYDPKKPREQQHGTQIGEHSTIRLIADAKTHRVIRQELIITNSHSPGTYQRIDKTDFRYNEPPPLNLRDIHPPKDMAR